MAGVGSDPRFVYNYAAVPQKIALGNAQDDPGLFITAIASNIADQRYLPFENAGAISSWHLEMPQPRTRSICPPSATSSSISTTRRSTAAPSPDGRAGLQRRECSDRRRKVFSAQNDFAAPAPTVANPYPLTPWQAFSRRRQRRRTRRWP